ncbi:MAG: DUF2062 domain-containing protein [Desulfobacterales bacterium]|nr:DUF2062 domain-containing protein [Desulfobacterales bacterium]MBF0395851.1 DUF2062 domain-containing protein [Desulfobacterales bacterium]
MNPQIIIVIPVYNHGKTLRRVVTESLKIHNKIIVVDDGSTDNLKDSLSGLDVKLVRHDKNLGKGAAILTGAKEAKKMGYTHIVTIDADGQHDPNDFNKFIPLIFENQLSIIVGIRNFEMTDTPSSSYFGRSFSNFWFRVQTGQKICDSQSGFRAYPIDVLEQLKLTEKHYSFEVEVLVKALWAGITIKEVNISVYYPPKELRVSHFKKIKDNYRIARINTKLTMRAMLPLPHKKIVNLSNDISPFKMALSSSLGVFLGTLPLIGSHTIAILFASSFFNLNKFVALSASQLCIPPFIPAICIEAGYFIRHGRFLTEISMQTIGYEALDRLYEYIIGSILMAPVFAILVYLIVYIFAFFLIKPKEKNTAKNWTSKSIGSKFQHKIFYFLIRISGQILSYPLLYIVVFYYVLFSSKARWKAHFYLSHRFPREKGIMKIINTYRLFLSFGKILIDRAMVGILGTSKIEINFYDKEKILELLAEKKGFILMMSHVGGWQVVLPTLSFLDVPVNMLIQREEGDIDLHYFEHRGISPPYRVIDPTSYLGGTLEILDVLKKGEILCVMGDRVLGSIKNGVHINFLGEKAIFPYSAFKIASVTSTPIVIFFSCKTGYNTYELKIAEIIRVPQNIGRKGELFIPYIEKFVHALESFVKEYPYQFFNFYNMWEENYKNQRKENDY